MNARSRPVSPHLQIYRWQITSVLSILHRMTGMALVAGLFALTWWLVAAAYGPGAFATAQSFFASWLGRLLLFGWTFCLFYHLANGLRHLAWDMGKGFELPTLRITGWVVVVAAVVLTIGTWLAAYAA